MSDDLSEKTDWCPTCGRGWSWVDVNVHRKAATRIADLECQLAELKANYDDESATCRRLRHHLAEAGDERQRWFDEAVRLKAELVEARSEAAEAKLDVPSEETRKLHDDQFHEVVRLRAHLAEANEHAAATIERCAKVCENETIGAAAVHLLTDWAYNSACGHCAAAIRALAAKE